MTAITARVGRWPITFDLFADITPVPVRSIIETAGVATVDFDGDLSPSQVDACLSRLESGSANEETIRNRAKAALSANDNIRSRMADIQADASVTNAEAVTYIKQIASDVDTLARECTGLIRLVLQRLESTDGT